MRLKKTNFLGGFLAIFFLCSAAQAADQPLLKKAKDPENPSPKVTNTQAAPTDIKVFTNTHQAQAEVISNTQSAAASDKTTPTSENTTAASANGESLPEPPPINTPDALASYNRVVFHFNDTLDRLFLKPTAVLYNKVTPRPVHRMVTNFFSNIDTIPTIVNDLLQIKLYYVLNDSWRLFINSTVGILGLFDVASHMGLMPHHEDFGLTLAYWGYKESNYFEVPFFGSGTIRDALGWPVDYFLFSVYPYISNPVVRYGIYGVGVVDRRSNFLQYQGVIDQVVIDRYVFYRNAYLQHRRYQIEENKESRKASPQ